MLKVLRILWELAVNLDKHWPEDSKFNDEKELLEAIAKFLTERVEERNG